MTMSYETLRDFVKEVIEIKGGMAEESQNGILEMLLPLDLRKKLSCKEYKEICFLPGCEEGEFITYGSPLLDKVISLTEEIGETAEVFIEDIRLKKENLTSLIENRFTFANSKKLGRLLTRRMIGSYLLINFRVSIISDEKKEKIVTTITDEHSLRTPMELIDPFLGLRSYYREEKPEMVMEKQPLEKVYEKAKRAAIKALDEDIKDLEASNLRRLKRDIGRIWNYYGELKKELRKKAMRRPFSEEKDKLTSKIEAINMEFEKKRHDLIDKYALKVSLKPINACRIYLPKMIIEYEVQRKTLKKKMNFIWNPLLRNIEPLVCEACLEDIYTIYLCNELHLIGPKCYSKCSKCGKKICKKCFPERCPNCGEKY